MKRKFILNWLYSVLHFECHKWPANLRTLGAVGRKHSGPWSEKCTKKYIERVPQLQSAISVVNNYNVWCLLETYLTDTEFVAAAIRA